jgi:Domain of unknown function (DUF5106)/Thioredoxin-like
MRSSTLLILLSSFWLTAHAQSAAPKGHEIKVTLKPFTSGYIFLGHHFGSKQYLVDSAKLNARSEVVFSGKDKLIGGVYMLIYPRKNGWIEMIVDKQQHFSVVADSANSINGTTFTNSPDNTLFVAYQKRSFEIGTRYKTLSDSIKGKTGADSLAIRDQMTALSKEVTDYRENFKKQHPAHLLSAIFNVLKEPVIPPAEQQPGGKYDSTFAYQYYKSHYWDGVTFTDERLLRTPVFIPKFDRYFSSVLPQAPDSIIPYAKALLDLSRPNKDMFQYTLSALTDKYVNPQYMGQDRVFVWLFEKYYLTGAADSWMTEKYKKFIFDRGYSLMANQLGEKGADLQMTDTLGKARPLYGVEGKYIILCFWDPTCSHCQAEVPKLDSLFQHKWKAMGVRLYGVMTDGGHENWLKYIRTHNLVDWIHVYQTEEQKNADNNANRPSYRQLYDVYQTPMIYLLDKDKRIIAKKLSYEQLDEFLEVNKKKSSQP